MKFRSEVNVPVKVRVWVLVEVTKEQLAGRFWAVHPEDFTL